MNRRSTLDRENIPAGQLGGEGAQHAPLNRTDFVGVERIRCTYAGWTLDRYVPDGFHYFVTNPVISRRYTAAASPLPGAGAPLRELRQHGCLLHVFRPNSYRDGPMILVYEVSNADSTSTATRSRDCTAPST